MPHLFNDRELLGSVDSDWSFLGDAVRMLAEDAPGLLVALRCAIDTGDGPAIERAAHTLKGMVSNFYAPDVQASALALERLGKRGSCPEALSALHELESYMNALVADLSDFVKTRI